MAKLPKDIFSKIRKIQVHTTQLAEDMLAGAWHSAFKGRGMEFEEVREYQTGDDIRSIDWNVTARMNHPFIKVFREERELTVILLVDVSASCRFGSHTELKKDLIAEIGATLAFTAIKNNDKVGLILFSDKVEKTIPPKKGTRHVLRVIRELLAYNPSGITTNLENALDYTGSVLRKTAICFLISDFLCKSPPKELSLMARKHDLISIRVTDPYECEFPKMELITLFDLETQEIKTIDASDTALLNGYKEKNLKTFSQLEKLMTKIGAGFIDIRTDQSYLLSLKKFFKTREIRH